MNVLVTGGLGNIGILVVNECLKRGHQVTAFDKRGKGNEKSARKLRKRNIKVSLGDIRNHDEIAAAASDPDAVIHLAAILPPISEEMPDLCKAVNVDGTANLVKALKKDLRRAAFVEVSSASVMGHTQEKIPPVGPEDELIPSDVYSRSKIEAEALVEESGLRHCILRLAAVIPTTINLRSIQTMIKLVFDMPLEARCEIVFDVDAADALVTAAEKLVETDSMSGKKGFIAGGQRNGCQILVKDLLESIFIPMGLDLPDERLFPADCNSYYLDWYDTTEIQSILDYQHLSLERWKVLFLRKYRVFRPLIIILRKAIANWLERKSPRFERMNHG